MTRVIYIIFTNVYLSEVNRIGKTRHAFLSNDDSIKIGDMIKDKNYSDKMLVVNITLDLQPHFNNLELKCLDIENINGNKLKQEILVSPNCERCVAISLEQAIEWFNSDNETLKKLALSAYTENELITSYADILSKVNIVNRNLYIPSENEANIKALISLTNIAKYFNGDWVKTISNTGYFIGNVSNNILSSCSIQSFNKKINNKYIIYRHMEVVYPGIVYFKDPEDIIRASKIMGENFNNL
jgi:hypothetical protein